MIEFLKHLFGIGPSVNFGELMANGAIIVDVRTKEEYQNGHLKNAVNIPLNVLSLSLTKVDKNKPIIICCASGIRSASGKSVLKSMGFKNVYNGGNWTRLKVFDK